VKDQGPSQASKDGFKKHLPDPAESAEHTDEARVEPGFAEAEIKALREGKAAAEEIDTPAFESKGTRRRRGRPIEVSPESLLGRRGGCRPSCTCEAFTRRHQLRKQWRPYGPLCQPGGQEKSGRQCP